ncbi:histidine phosphatase family protein [Nocardioides psychrotolerans]
MSVRHLYLTRHAEPDDDGRLTERGAQQAVLLGRRLSEVLFGSVQHGPLPRATQTAYLGSSAARRHGAGAGHRARRCRRLRPPPAVPGGGRPRAPGRGDGILG